MKPGETIRLDCESCSTEFEVTLEPKLAGRPRAERDLMASLTVTHCPFCGGKAVTGDEENAE